MILTDRRFVYIKFSGGKYLTAKVEDYTNNINEGLRNEGSFAVPLNVITEAKADRTWGTPYFRLRYQTPEGEKACSFTLISSMMMLGAGGVVGVVGLMKSPYEQIAKTIEQLKSNYKP